MKILYAGQLSDRDSALHRLWALERLGHTVERLDALGYQPDNGLLQKVLHRAQVGPWVRRLNHDVLAAAERERPDVFWADKLLSLRPETLVELRARGIATVSYMIDNAFGPRRDPGWRLYLQDIPLFDLHVVQRKKDIAAYVERGARDVIQIQTAYEPTLHFPPPNGWSDAERTRGVSFIGTAYDDRAEVLTRLWKDCGFPVVISGDKQWKTRLSSAASAALYTGGELYGTEYREGIWQSKVNLSFLTHSNEDEFVHKSFEIAGCGGFLLAERSDGHQERFVEDEEAVFFKGFDELVEKLKRWLPDEAGRARVAAAGCLRARRSGYDNDSQMAKVMERIGNVRQLV